jgi:L-Ala-D/L-Glu epimerase
MHPSQQKILSMDVTEHSWPLIEPFTIARDTWTEQGVIHVTLTDIDGYKGRGEGCGVDYHGETPASMRAQLEAVRSHIESGITRQEAIAALPPGGARFALDSALWDLESRRSGKAFIDPSAFPITTAYTIGIRSLEEFKIAAQARANYPLLKLKVKSGDPFPMIDAARAGAPNAKFIVDPNQAWSVEELKAYAPRLAERNVVLLEQPIAVGAEDQLDGWTSPIKLAADELIDTAADLDRAIDRFHVINIKLDKTGGLTTALELADKATEMGFDLMIGCMTGSSLAMVPALVIATHCAFVDLDGPLLQSEDVAHGLRYENGHIQAPNPQLWGGG